MVFSGVRRARGKTRPMQIELARGAWTASHKGRPLLVHVDPHDPSRSVLRKKELEQLEAEVGL